MSSSSRTFDLESYKLYWKHLATSQTLSESSCFPFLFFFRHLLSAATQTALEQQHVEEEAKNPTGPRREQSFQQKRLSHLTPEARKRILAVNKLLQEVQAAKEHNLKQQAADAETSVVTTPSDQESTDDKL